MVNDGLVWLPFDVPTPSEVGNRADEIEVWTAPTMVGTVDGVVIGEIDVVVVVVVSGIVVGVAVYVIGINVVGGTGTAVVGNVDEAGMTVVVDVPSG